MVAAVESTLVGLVDVQIKWPVVKKCFRIGLEFAMMGGVEHNGRTLHNWPVVRTWLKNIMVDAHNISRQAAESMGVAEGILSSLFALNSPKSAAEQLKPIIEVKRNNDLILKLIDVQTLRLPILMQPEFKPLVDKVCTACSDLLSEGKAHVSVMDILSTIAKTLQESEMEKQDGLKSKVAPLLIKIVSDCGDTLPEFLHFFRDAKTVQAFSASGPASRSTCSPRLRLACRS